MRRPQEMVKKRDSFTEAGQKAGQSLFQIDNAPHLQRVETARASLATAQANLAKASSDVTRYRPLVQANAISKQSSTRPLHKSAWRVHRCKAPTQRSFAQINVGYASVLAPISGRIGKALVTEGALVSQASGTQLTRFSEPTRSTLT